jgi:hypothetical protein
MGMSALPVSVAPNGMALWFVPVIRIGSRDYCIPINSAGCTVATEAPGGLVPLPNTPRGSTLVAGSGLPHSATGVSNALKGNALDNRGDQFADAFGFVPIHEEAK